MRKSTLFLIPLVALALTACVITEPYDPPATTSGPQVSSSGTNTGTVDPTTSEGPGPIVVKVEEITLDKTSITMNPGDEEVISFSVSPEEAANKEVYWTSQNPGVATVNDQGLVTAVAAGSTKIIATAKDGGGATAECAVKVNGSGPEVETTVKTTINYLASTYSWVLQETPYTEFNIVSESYTATDISSKVEGSLTHCGKVYEYNSVKNWRLYVNENPTWTISCSTKTIKSVKLTYENYQDGTKNVVFKLGESKYVSGDVIPVNASSVALGLEKAEGATGAGHARVQEIELVLSESGGGEVVHVTSVSTSAEATNIFVGATTKVTASILPTNATNQAVTWSSDNEAVATVNNGIVTGVSAGTANITATSVDGGKTSSVAITVEEEVIPVTGVSFASTSETLVVNESKTLSYTVLPSNATNKSVSFSSSATSVATVDSTGKVKAISQGSATITVETADGNKTATCAITVNPVTKSVTGVTLDKSTNSIYTGDEFTLVATVAPSDASNKNVSWSSSATIVATVDSTGKVKGVGPGSATITVTTEDGNKTATCVVTVTKSVVHVTSVSVSGTSTLAVGGNVTLSATVLPADADDKSVTWSSSATSIATVDSTGKVTGVAVGNATIKATSTDGGKVGSLAITVNDGVVHVTSVSVSGTSTVSVGGNVTLSATVLPTNASNKSVNWSSSATSIATVDSTGKVTGVAAGKSTITATSVDGGKVGSLEVTVSSSSSTVLEFTFPEKRDTNPNSGAAQTATNLNKFYKLPTGLSFTSAERAFANSDCYLKLGSKSGAGTVTITSTAGTITSVTVLWTTDDGAVSVNSTAGTGGTTTVSGLSATSFTISGSKSYITKISVSIG